MCSRSRTPNASTFQAERAIAVRSPRVGQEVRPLCASPLRTARCQGAPSAAPHLLATASYVCMCLVALGSAHCLPATGLQATTHRWPCQRATATAPTHTHAIHAPPTATQLTSQGQARDVRPRGRPPAYKAPPPRGNVSSSCALEWTWQSFSALRCAFLWRAHCCLSQRGLGNGLCWPCQPCAAQPPWHAPPPPPHLSYPRPRLHTTPPAQLAALGRARDGRSPGRPPLNRSPPPRRGVCCYVRCMRGPGRHNRLLGAPHSCGTLQVGVATITELA